MWICSSFGRITKGIGSKYVCAYLDIEKLLITKVYKGILSGSMSVEEFQTGVQQKCSICKSISHGTMDFVCYWYQLFIIKQKKKYDFYYVHYHI